jgi:site-specific recombinase XerD
MAIPHIEHYLKERLRSRKTVDAYLFDIRRFIDLNPKYETYRYGDISAYFTILNEKYRRQDGRVTSSVARIFVSVKWLYSFLVHSGIRDTHPFPPSYNIKGTSKKGVDGSGILTPSELQYLVDFVKDEEVRYTGLRQRNLTIVSLLVFQALTGQEISNLGLSDIDLDAGTIHVKKTLTANGRTLPIHPSQFMIFHAYLTDARKKLLKDPEEDTFNKSFIISSRASGNLVGLVGSLIKKYRLLFGGKPVTAENIRKSVIWNMLNVDGKPVEQVQLFAGHMWPSTTEGYVSKIDFNDIDLVNGVHPMELL